MPIGLGIGVPLNLRCCETDGRPPKLTNGLGTPKTAFSPQTVSPPFNWGINLIEFRRAWANALGGYCFARTAFPGGARLLAPRPQRRRPYKTFIHQV